MVLFWAVGHPGAPEVISCRRLCILSGCQAGSVCCFCTPLSAWTCSSKVRESRGEGIKHVVSSLICFCLFSPLISFLSLILSLYSSLVSSLSPTPSQSSPLSLPPSVSLCFSLCLPLSLSPLLLCLSFVAVLKKSYFLDFLQNRLGALQGISFPSPCFDYFE